MKMGHKLVHFKPSAHASVSLVWLRQEGTRQLEHLPPLGATIPGKLPVPSICPRCPALEGARNGGKDKKMREKTRKWGKRPENGGKDPKIHGFGDTAGGLSRPHPGIPEAGPGHVPCPVAFASSGCPSVSRYSSFGGAMWVHGGCVSVHTCRACPGGCAHACLCVCV